jgi:transcriptional regulator with XRE-family HTH domain
LIDLNGGSTVLYVGNLLPGRSEQNVAVEAQGSPGRHDLEQDHGWPAWGAAIREALERRGITINSAASRLGMRNTTLKRWLSGEVPPQLSRLASFAELTGVSQAVQLELGNVLPPELRAEAHAMQVADRLRNALGEIEGAVSRASELAFSDVRWGRDH